MQTPGSLICHRNVLYKAIIERGSDACAV